MNPYYPLLLAVLSTNNRTVFRRRMLETRFARINNDILVVRVPSVPSYRGTYVWRNVHTSRNWQGYGDVVLTTAHGGVHGSPRGVRCPEGR